MPASRIRTPRPGRSCMAPEAEGRHQNAAGTTTHRPASASARRRQTRQGHRQRQNSSEHTNTTHNASPSSTHRTRDRRAKRDKSQRIAAPRQKAAASNKKPHARARQGASSLVCVRARDKVAAWGPRSVSGLPPPASPLCGWPDFCEASASAEQWV